MDKEIYPLNVSPCNTLFNSSFRKMGWGLLLGKERPNIVATALNHFWKDILENFSDLQNEKVIDGNHVLSQFCQHPTIHKFNLFRYS